MNCNNMNTLNMPVVDMNMQGIELLQQSRYADAINTFRKAMAALLLRLKDAQHFPIRREPSCHSADDSKHDRLIFSIAIDTETGTSVTHTDCPQPNNDDGVFVLFDRALHLCPEISRKLETTGVLSQLLSGVLLFNCGLAFHLMALRMGGSSSLLSNALQFYQVAEESFTNMNQTVFVPTNCPGSLFLGLLAPGNNIGHIQAGCFYNLKEAETRRNRLYINLADAVQSTRESGQFCLSDEEFTAFYMNTCFFQEINLQTAPAA